jgi:glutathione S-transferase
VDFYFGRCSGNSARAAFALAEAGAAYTPHPITTPGGDENSDWYRKLNPMGKVPTLVDGELRLWESNAINWYVAEKHAQSRLLPASIAGQASVQRWLLFQTAHVSPASQAVYRMTNKRMQNIWKVTPDAQAAAAGRKELDRYLTVLEWALAERPWLEGDFSIADIAYAPHCWLLAEGGFDFSATPRVRGWLERLWARPAWKAAVEMAFAVG